MAEESYEIENRVLEQHANGHSPGVQYSAGGEDEEQNDPDTVLPYMLFEQESHDLICPVCEHSVTGEVILQKRKREFEPAQSGGRPHEILASLHEGRPREGLSKRAVEDSSEDSAEEGDFEIHSTLQEQTKYDLLCPDCESCITHDLILQKRKRVGSASDSLPQRKPWTEGRGAHPSREGSHPSRSVGEIEELYESDDDDPPFKRHRKSEKAADADPDRNIIRRIIQNQRIYDLSCPDCASQITYQVILKQKTSASGNPLGHLEKRGRRRHKRPSGNIDDNPWKTRYKLAYGHSKPLSAAERAKLDRPRRRGGKYGTKSLSKPVKDRDSQSQGATNGTATGKLAEKRSPAQPVESKGQLLGPAKYGSETADRSLTEPLLQTKQDDTEEGGGLKVAIASGYRDFKSQTQALVGWCAITYFIIFLFLYCVWWLLRVI